MDPDQIIKAAPELLKHGAELVGALKLSEITKAILGPATGEFAERVKDEIRLYRFGRQLELLKKAEKMVQDAGFTPKAVPIKLLFPLLEGASLEENDDLHTMWAALLANAGDPSRRTISQPAYADILKQLTADQAMFLELLYGKTVKRSADLKNKPKATMLDLFAISSPVEFFGLYCEASNLSSAVSDSDDSDPRQHRRQYKLAVDNLFRLRLIRERLMTKETDFQSEASVHHTNADTFYFASGPRVLYFSTLGFEFIRSCSPPKPKS